MSTSRDKIIETAMNLGIECGSLADPSWLVVKLSADRELRVSFSATGSITATRLRTSAGSVRLDGGVDVVRDLMRRDAFDAAEKARRERALDQVQAEMSQPAFAEAVEALDEVDPLADEKKLLDLVVGGLDEKRRTVAHGAPVTEDPADERSIETVADLDRWGGPASEVLEPVAPVVRTQEEMRANRVEIPVRSEIERMTQAIADETATAFRPFASIAERRSAVRTLTQSDSQPRKLTNREALSLAAGAISALYGNVREAQPFVSQAVDWALRGTETTAADREAVRQLAMLINVATRDFT